MSQQTEADASSIVPFGCAVLLYDGLCGFCNGSVRWVAKRDRQDRFRFAPQQSQVAVRILARHGVDGATLLADDSVYLVLDYGSHRETLLRRSEAALSALVELGGFWRIVGSLGSLIPRWIRDAAYAFIAKIRFRIAGRYKTCPLPPSEVTAKFLS